MRNSFIKKYQSNSLVFFITLFLVLTIGISYAFFSYNQVGSNNQLIVGNIYMHYNEMRKGISLQGALPESDDIARSRNDNYMTFTIDGVNTTKDKDIYYEILLSYGNDISGKNRLNDDHLKFDLEETTIIDGTETTNTVLTGASYSELNNRRIWVNTINKNTTSEITITYKLRMWISDEVWISDTDVGADYMMSEYQNSFASIRVNVYGDFVEKTLPNAVSVIKSKVGTDGLVAVNTNGDLASDGDTIREYRYSGSSKYCTYTIDGSTYRLNVDIDTCPSACYDGTSLYRADNEYISVLGNGCSTEVSPNESNPLDGKVDNYVWFNNEMWRIIGVFNVTKSDSTKEELIKIVRDEPLFQEEVPNNYIHNGIEMRIKYAYYSYYQSKYANIYWNDNKYFDQVNENDWTKSAIQYYLNDKENSDSYYNKISSSSKEMIETVIYHIGNVSKNTKTVGMYDAERGINVFNGNETVWTGKIGMMYPSDYGYASNNINWEINLSFYDKLNNTGSQDNWIKDDIAISQWFISPSENYSNSVNCIRYLGNISDGDVNSFNDISTVSPVLYLKSSVEIVDGTGDYDNPYILSY